MRLFWVPMTLALVIMWIMLIGSFSLGWVTLGFLLSFGLMVLSVRLRPDMANPRRVGVMIKLFFMVMKDMFNSNIEVAKLTLTATKEHQPKAGLVDIPLNLRDPHAIALLACIVNYIPGTVWSGVSEEGYVMRLHVFGLVSVEDWYHFVHERYEPLLMEIFEND